MQTPIPRRTIVLLWLSVASVTHAQPAATKEGAEQKLTAAPAVALGTDPVTRIRDEGLNRSEVMATLIRNFMVQTLDWGPGAAMGAILITSAVVLLVLTSWLGERKAAT